MTAFPPEPWDLTGHAYVGVFLVPARHAPPPDAPGTRPVRLLGRVLVGAAWFVYEDPSPLTYRELMATQVVRDGARPRVSITHIWVDSPASRDGGRALWAIPKDLMDFAGVDPHRAYAGRLATAEGPARPVGAYTPGRLRWLPGRWPVGFRTAQGRGAHVVTTPVRGRVRLGIGVGRGRGTWSFAADGPLGFLAGRRPVLVLGLRPFRLLFGPRA